MLAAKFVYTSSFGIDTGGSPVHCPTGQGDLQRDDDGRDTARQIIMHQDECNRLRRISSTKYGGL